MNIAKQLLFFMTPDDERVFSAQIKARFPGVVVLDDNTWPTKEPIAVASIDQCKSGYAHLWHRILFPHLPVSQRRDGKFQGPTVGPVLQFVRCLSEANVLRSGRIALGLSAEKLTDEIDRYFTNVWSMIKKPATSKLICIAPETRQVVNPKVSGYWAWPDAVKWCQTEPSRFFRDRATQNFYLPV